MKVFMIRAPQGVLTDRVFLRPPTEDEMNEVLGSVLAQYGHKNGRPVDREVSYIAVETVGEPADAPETALKVTGKLTAEESAEVLRAKSADQASGQVVTEQDGIKFEGVGEVIYIEDPRHPRYAKGTNE